MIRQQQEKIEYLRQRVRMFEEQNSASMQVWAEREMEKARNASCNAILDGVAMVHQAKRENAQDVPEDKPQAYTMLLDRIKRVWWWTK